MVWLFHNQLSCQNLAVGRLLNVLVDYYFAYAVCHDFARCRVLYALDVSAYVRLESGIFEGSVAFGVEGAVLKHQILGVAQRLLARDVAVDQSQSARMPTEKLAVELRVVHGYVVNLPE